MVSVLQGALAVLVCLAVHSEAQVPANETSEHLLSFDCRQTGVNCQSASTCTVHTAPECNCTAEYESYDCNLPKDPSRRQCASGLQCANGGTCYTADDGQDKCQCTMDFTGALCRQKRVQHKCEAGGSLFIHLIPHGDPGRGFQGKIYLEGREDTCVFSPSDLDVGRRFNFTDQDCGRSGTEPTTANGQIHFFNVMVQHSKEFATSLDTKIIFRCQVGADGTVATLQSNATRVNVTSLSTSFTTKQSTASLPLGIHLQLIRMGGQRPIADQEELNLGDPVQLVVTLDPTDYEHFQVMSITADNMLDGDQRQEFSLVENSCFQREAKPVLRSMQILTTKQGKKVANFIISTFKFSKNNQVKFTARIKVCESAGTCGLGICGPNTFNDFSPNMIGHVTPRAPNNINIQPGAGTGTGTGTGTGASPSQPISNGSVGTQTGPGPSQPSSSGNSASGTASAAVSGSISTSNAGSSSGSTGDNTSGTAGGSSPADGSTSGSASSATTGGTASASGTSSGATTGGSSAATSGSGTSTGDASGSNAGTPADNTASTGTTNTDDSNGGATFPGDAGDSNVILPADNTGDGSTNAGGNAAAAAAANPADNTAPTAGDGTTAGAADGSTKRRRRRAAGEQDGSVHSMDVSLRVKTLTEEIESIKKNIENGVIPEQKGCLQNVVFLLPLILLAFMLVISMGMTLYFCMKVTRIGKEEQQHHHHSGAVNMGYKA